MIKSILIQSTNTSQHESKRINTNLTLVNTNQHDSNKSPTQFNTDQEKSKSVRWVNMSQRKSDTSITQVNLS